MKHDWNRRGFTALKLTALVGGLYATSNLHANPKGGTVTNGAITITEGPGVMTINQSTPRGIIHWQDFSIGAGELTQFQHLDAKSATLNRVVGGIPSTIQGTLQANGQIYLINPNGILVGPGGRVNTAAFVASTLDVPDAQFMAGGDMNFSGPSLQGVVNLGVITATTGDVILMGRNVLNAGSIEAPNGVAALAAGNDILLQAAGDERVVINSGIPGGGTGAENTGSIKAAQAELKAAGGNVYALAVNNTGVIKATGIAQKNGRVILSSNGGVVQNSGQISAKNLDRSGGSVKLDSGKGGSTTNNGSIDASADDSTKNGGTVELLGDTVTVGSSSVINVNGQNAGTVAIGVSALIANQTTAAGGIATLTEAPALPGAAPISTAQQTTIQANSRIMANSTSAGNGGRVVVWSEKQSVVGGVIEAKGGDLSGNGGLVETSGRTGLTITPGTKVNTNAPKGKSGTWLLDPAGITIDASASPTDTSGGNPPFNQNAATNHVMASDISDALFTGSNVTVSTSSLFPVGNRDIIVNADVATISLAPNVTLTLNSAGGITINNTIGSSASNTSLNLIAKGDIAFVGIGKAATSSLGTVFLDTHTSSTATITGAAGSNAVVAGKLGITSGRQGIGTSASPLTTSVSNLEATVASNSQTTGGGIFIKNSGTNLHIGGVDPTLNGVQVSNLPGFGGIEITNIAGDLFLDSATAERITAPGNIKLTTSNSFDIQVLNASPNSIRSHNGSVTLNAGRHVFIGDAATLGINVRGQTRVDVTAGGDVSVSGSLLKAGGSTGLTVNAGGDINILSSGGFAATIGTSGGVPVNLTTGLGKTFNNNTLANGGVKTTLADDITSTVSTGANVNIVADKVAINSPINAGSTSSVNFNPVTLTRAFDVGTKNSSKLSFTPAELGIITAQDVNILTFFGTGALDVSASLAALPFKNLLLVTNGAVSINSNIDVGSGNLGIGGGAAGISGAGNLTTAALTLSAPLGPVNLSGVIDATSLIFHSGAATTLTNVGNSIVSIGASSAGSSGLIGIGIKNGLTDLHIAGTVTTSGFSSIITGGDIYFDAGGSLSAPGIQLDISNGHFINNAGAGALTATGGGRFIVYEKDPFGSHNVGGLDLSPSFANQDTSNPVLITDLINDPLVGGNVFYFAIVTPPTPPPAPPAAAGTPPRRYGVLSVKAESFSDFAAKVFSKFQLGDVLSFLADPTVLADPEKLGLVMNQYAIVLSYGLIGVHFMTDAEVAESKLQYARKYQADQLNAFARALGVSELTATQKDYFFANFTAGSSLAGPSAVNPSSLSPDQIGLLTKAQALQLLASAGCPLSTADRQTALSATMTEDQLKGILSKGPLEGQAFAAIVASGAGNLTLQQIVASGAGNLITNDGGGFSVLDKSGKVISNDGASFYQTMAALNSKDGAFLADKNGTPLITNDGGGLITNDGAGLISNDGAGLISNDGAGLFAKGILGVISNDGASIVAAHNQLISNDGAGIFSDNGLGLISNDGGGLISNDGGGLINRNSASSLLGPGNGNSNSIISGNSSAIISGNSSAVISTNGSGFANPAMKP